MKERERYFLDTNIFLRVLIRDQEREFQECFTLLSEIKEGKITAFTSTLVLAEINWTLLRTYKFPKEKAVVGTDAVLSLRNLKIVDDFHARLGLLLYKEHSVKFIDALLASHKLIQEKKAVIVSYDKDFDKLGVLRKEPGEIMKRK